MNSWRLSAKKKPKSTIELLILSSICTRMNTSDFSQLRKGKI